MKEHNRNLEIKSFNNSEDLYKSITKEGSLGLLALGWQGLFLWRKKRAELGEVYPPDESKGGSNMDAETRREADL